MIELRIADYCHNCPEFEPDIDKYVFQGTEPIVKTTVTCEHHQRCESMLSYIKTQLTKENGNA